MRFSELSPEIVNGNLFFNCPGGCGQRMRVPFSPESKDTTLWNLTGTLPDITVSPSVRIFDHSHFNITKGEIIDHKDVVDIFVSNSPGQTK